MIEPVSTLIGLTAGFYIWRIAEQQCWSFLKTFSCIYLFAFTWGVLCDLFLI